MLTLFVNYKYCVFLEITNIFINNKVYYFFYKLNYNIDKNTSCLYYIFLNIILFNFFFNSQIFYIINLYYKIFTQLRI